MPICECFTVFHLYIHSSGPFFHPKDIDIMSPNLLGGAIFSGPVGCSWRSGGCDLTPTGLATFFYRDYDHEIFSMVIFSLRLIQEGQLSVCGKRMCTILVNRLED